MFYWTVKEKSLIRGFFLFLHFSGISSTSDGFCYHYYLYVLYLSKDCDLYKYIVEYEDGERDVVELEKDTPDFEKIRKIELKNVKF
jgi:hypothetical protein